MNDRGCMKMPERDKIKKKSNDCRQGRDSMNEEKVRSVEGVLDKLTMESGNQNRGVCRRF